MVPGVGRRLLKPPHIAVLYETAQASKKKSSAILFVDAKSAYYCVIRQLVYGCSAGEEDQAIQRIMRHFRLPDASWQQLLQTIQDGGLLREHGFNDHICHLTKDLHDASFFVTRHATGNVVMETQLGSRPGESIADVIFAWIFHRVLDGVEHALGNAGCAEWVDASDDRSLWDEAGSGRTPILGPVWADDGAFMTSHEDAEQLWYRAQSLATGVLSVFSDYGLTPNLEKGKTEMMLTFRGNQSRKMQVAVFGHGSKTMTVNAGTWGTHELRLVTEYTHLGCALDRGATLRYEALRRLSRAQGAFQEHRRRIYQNVSIPLPVRGVLFTAMVESTFFNLEIWGTMEGPAWEKLRTGHAKLLRRLMVRDFTAERLLSARQADFVAASEHPPLDVIVRGRRLRYLITLVRGAPKVLWALLHYEGQWKAQCRRDLAWMVQHDTAQWPDIREANWPEWWHIIRDTPAPFRRAIARATRAATAAFAVQGVIQRVHDGMMRDAYRSCPEAFRAEGHEIWVRGPCRKVFAKKAHLACHCFKTHQRKSEVRYFLSGAVCKACGKVTCRRTDCKSTLLVKRPAGNRYKPPVQLLLMWLLALGAVSGSSTVVRLRFYFRRNRLKSSSHRPICRVTAVRRRWQA